MSKKIVWGVAIGAAAAVVASLVYKSLQDEESPGIWEDYDNGSETLELANDYLSKARVKAKELVDYANMRSDQLLGEANSILLIAKQKAEEALKKGDAEAEEELNKVKSEIERLIAEYEKKLSDN